MRRNGAQGGRSDGACARASRSKSTPTFAAAPWNRHRVHLPGVAATATAISLPDLPARGWTIFFGVISVIAGVVVVAWPFGSLVVLTVVAGIWLVVIGMTEIVGGFAMRNDLKKAEQTVARVVHGAPTRAA
ncbi:MAG: DUF308 domain-containing protein [Mycolicibacterium sp.]|nr:DUF308 domain-containing protein [Mycolicibacterium sp.]